MNEIKQRFVVIEELIQTTGPKDKQREDFVNKWIADNPGWKIEQIELREHARGFSGHILAVKKGLSEIRIEDMETWKKISSLFVPGDEPMLGEKSEEDSSEKAH